VCVVFALKDFSDFISLIFHKQIENHKCTSAIFNILSKVTQREFCNFFKIFGLKKNTNFIFYESDCQSFPNKEKEFLRVMINTMIRRSK